MNWRPHASLKVIHERARIYRQIRAFFNIRGYLEVDTPSLLASTNSDVNIESLSVVVNGQPRYLQTSPEFAMKRLLAAGSGSIFQLGHAFRQGESGRQHNPEFCMLEWYRVDYDYQQLMNEMELLITSLSLRQCEFSRIGYAELFQQNLELDIHQIGLEALRQQCATRVSGSDSQQLDFDQCLDLLLGMVIAPSLQGYQFVYDYPISQAALARARADDAGSAERFELFYDGIELANGFSELTDANEQRARWERDNELRSARGLPQQALDENLQDALVSGLPECAGVALGLDRLLMILLDLDSIEQVLTFTD